MALTPRQTIRAEVSTLFDDIAELQANYDYPVLEIKGQSPVLTLHGDGSRFNMISANNNENNHYFIATVMINRAAHGVEVAEDLLDTVVTAVFQRIRNNPTGTSYMTITADAQRTQPQFVLIDGLPYRIEEIGIAVRSNING